MLVLHDYRQLLFGGHIGPGLLWGRRNRRGGEGVASHGVRIKKICVSGDTGSLGSNGIPKPNVRNRIGVWGAGGTREDDRRGIREQKG
jgi:hypothetical protein